MSSGAIGCSMIPVRTGDPKKREAFRRRQNARWAAMAGPVKVTHFSTQDELDSVLKAGSGSGPYHPDEAEPQE
jgi:hypothetical protein